MRRRDLLKALGIGGLIPFVGKEAEAATPQVPTVEPQPLSIYSKGSVTVYGETQLVVAGTAFPEPPTTLNPYAIRHAFLDTHYEQDIHSLIGYLNAMCGGGE